MFVYRDYRWRDLPVLVHRTMRTVAMVMTLIAFAASVGYVMAPDAGAGAGHRTALDPVERQERDPVVDQHPAAGVWAACWTWRRRS